MYMPIGAMELVIGDGKADMRRETYDTFWYFIVDFKNTN